MTLDGKHPGTCSACGGGTYRRSGLCWACDSSWRKAPAHKRRIPCPTPGCTFTTQTDAPCWRCRQGYKSHIERAA